MRPRASGGFTLIEMVASLVIVAVLGAIAATMMGKGFSTFFLGREVAQNDWQGRLAIERMTRDIRAARTPGDITTMTAGQLTYTDADNDTVSYQLSGTTLTRTQNGGTPQVLADYATALNFTYLQDDGATAAAANTNVYFITIELTISSANASTTYRSTVRPVTF